MLALLGALAEVLDAGGSFFDSPQKVVEEVLKVRALVLEEESPFCWAAVEAWAPMGLLSDLVEVSDG